MSERAETSDSGNMERGQPERMGQAREAYVCRRRWASSRWVDDPGALTGRSQSINHENTSVQAKDGSWTARQGFEHQRGTASGRISETAFPTAAQLGFGTQREDTGSPPARQFDRCPGRSERMRAQPQAMAMGKVQQMFERS